MDKRNLIFGLVKNIAPFDSLEKEHQQFCLQWIESGADLFRTQKPDIPKIHLVSYFVVLNPEHNKVLLGHHKIAQLWLPSGGHVDEDEHPQDTVKRECFEELKITAHFLEETPLFLTVTDVYEKEKKHTDIPFWFVIEADDQIQIDYCKDEYHSMKWFGFNEIPFEKSDPHMKRFMNKLKNKYYETDNRRID